MRALKASNPGHVFWGLGGDEMITEGLESFYHVKDLSVTGFVEVIKHLRFFHTVMKSIVRASKARKPDAAILLDYPGFNLRLGLKLSALGIPVYYYISPQVWAWKRGRIKVMRQFIRRIFVIFPFELEFYKDHDIPVTFTGHPLVEKDFPIPDRGAFFATHGLDEKKPLVALLPGSRRNEVSRLITPVVKSIHLLRKKHPELQFAVACLSSLDPAYYTSLKGLPGVALVFDDPYPLIAFSRAAIVASGTASLETAFLGTPLVVIYKIAPLSYLIGKLLVKVDHLAMPNLILGERAIPELIQNEANPHQISRNIEPLLIEGDTRREMVDKLKRLKTLLGAPGCATIIADQILKDLA